MVRRIHFFAATIAALIGFASVPAAAQSGRTFYIDYASGSNANNGTSRTTPWKTHPYMNHSAGCDNSSGPTYQHQAGDRFIFKGGVTWPAACFTMSIGAGGTPSAQDYYGVDLTWYSGGAFTRPLWDLNYAALKIVVWGSSGDTGYHTFDNIEIARQGISLPVSYASGQAFQFVGNGATGTVIENCYIHDWATSDNVTSGSLGSYSIGVAASSGSPTPTNGIRFLNNTVSDANGYFYVNGVRHNGGFGGACENCSEVGGNTFHDLMAACFSSRSCHDNEFYNMDAVNIALYDPSVHSQIIEDDSGGNSRVYNNYLHDSPAAVSILVCPGSPVYNNVFYNLTNQAPIRIDAAFCFAQNPATATEYIYNNTADCSTTGACVRLARTGETIGTVYLRNNLWIGVSGTGVSVEAKITNYNDDHNYVMDAAEASSYGFTKARKFFPASSDPNIASQGVNLTSSCSGDLTALCTDTQGAPWYGGSYVARPTMWDLGAYQFGEQSASKPSAPNNLSATVQ